MTNPSVLSLVEAKDRLHYWQQLLRLGDWAIDLRMARGRDINEALAEVHASHPLRHARVFLKEPIDIDPDSYLNTDMEVNLVHELLHLRLKDALPEVENGSAQWRGLEAAIEATAQALVALKRKKRFRENK